MLSVCRVLLKDLDNLHLPLDGHPQHRAPQSQQHDQSPQGIGWGPPQLLHRLDRLPQHSNHLQVTGQAQTVPGLLKYSALGFFSHSYQI